MLADKTGWGGGGGREEKAMTVSTEVVLKVVKGMCDIGGRVVMVVVVMCPSEEGAREHECELDMWIEFDGESESECMVRACVCTK